ncbi:hypothetical protein PAEPH01_1426 [Pancytospora epiphaga]|nr:hypothetical protein PAEPH01_1426 [Pancytospora epiphaga]
MKSYLTCLYKDNKLEDLISKIGKGEIFQSKYFNVLLCELEHIILNPAYNMNVFLRLFRETMENSNILLQILVLLTGAKFLKFNEIRDELIKILDEVKHPGSIYLPYIGNMYYLRHRNCTPNTFWSVEEFIEAVDSSFLLKPITCQRVFYYLRLIFIYENTCFYNNFRIFVISILKMRNINQKVKRDVLNSLASSGYYRRLMYFNLNNIMTQICVHRLMKNYKMLRKTLSNILSNYDFSFQHDDALFPTIVSFCS